MKRVLSAVAMSVIAMMFLIGGPAAEAATPGAGVVVGTGTVSPALTDVPKPTAVTFTGTAVGTAGGNVGVCNLGFTGSGPADTTTAGSGSGTLTCGAVVSVPGTLSVSCGVKYDRVGAVVLVQATTGCGPVVGNPVAVCVFVPTSTPTTSYALVCAFVLT